MNRYTVIGFDADQLSEGRDGMWIEWTEALTPEHAAHLTRKKRAEENSEEPDEVLVVAVFDGFQSDQYDDNKDDEAAMAKLDAQMAKGRA